MVLGKIGCTPILVNMLKQLCRGMKATVVMSGRSLDEIPIDIRVKREDFLAPIIFLISFSAMLTHG